jgi:hypothetical protein
MSSDYILVHLANIDLFCVFEKEQYLLFAGNIEEPVDLYQIILAGKRQKMVFACTDSKYFAKLQTYARDCFNADVRIAKNQITVDIVNSSESDITDNYSKLYKYVERLGDNRCLEVMYEISILRESAHRYRKFSLSDNIGESSPLLRSIIGNITSRCTTVDKV